MIADIVGFLLIFLITLFLAVPLGAYMKIIYSDDKSPGYFLKNFEDKILRLCKIDPLESMDWKRYLIALLVIQPIWLFPAFIVLLFQNHLFLNPTNVGGMEWSLAINTTISFLTSTNLQHYAGESGVSYFSQLAVLTFLQFLSAGTSLAAGVAVVRGLTSGSGTNIGNFYSDFLKSITRILLPLSVIVGLLFMLGGMPMNFHGPDKIITLQKDTVQVAKGPVAAMIPIKELGSNGGGFYGANDAHPFENPNFATLILHFIIVLLLPMAFVFFIGNYLSRKKFARMLFCIMTVGVVLLAIPIIKEETAGNPKIAVMGIKQPTGNMEGKEVRFGVPYSAYYCAINVAVPAGTVISVHDSYMPLSAVAMLVGMQADVFFGGLGTGWINIFIYLIIAVFISTLMIGRSPELFGKKVGIREMQVAALVTVMQILVPVVFAGIACFIYINSGSSTGWLSNKGAHGFTTLLYEFVSSVAGNGSNFGGLANNTIFWNLTTALAMLSGRFVPIIGAIIIAGLLKGKKYIPPSPGTLQTDSATFGTFLFAVIIILNVLSLFVVLMAGPITEHFLLAK